MPFTAAGIERMYEGGGLVSATASIWLSLHSDDPTAGNELTGTNMARIEIEDTDMDTGGANYTLNAAQAFPEPTQDIGTATHFGVYSAATGGTLLGYAPITDADGNAASVVITAGTRVRFPALGLRFNIADS